MPTESIDSLIFESSIDLLLKINTPKMSRKDYDDLISNMTIYELKTGLRRNDDILVELARREFEDIGEEAAKIFSNEKTDVLKENEWGGIFR